MKKKRLLLPVFIGVLLLAATATISGAAAAVPNTTALSVTAFQVISPADGDPVVTTAQVAPAALPAALLGLTIDWSALGFIADPTYDPTLEYDDTQLADAGPTTDTLADPPSTGGTLIVDNHTATDDDCPFTPYTSIQSAVDAAAPGAHISVCPGTYVEQVLIPVGKDKLTLQSKKPLQAVIQAPAVMTSPKAIVRINAQNVRLQQFTIQGPGGGPCDSLEEGVYVDQGGSAVIEHNHITHIRDNPLGGCQNGLAVRIGHQVTDNTTGSARVSHNKIDDFQKGGIVVDNTGSNATIDKNVVQGVGPTPLIAANGIQISRGATADVKNNHVSGNVYSPMTVSSTGILLFQAGSTDVENNKVHDNDVGIYAYATDGSTTVEKNAVVKSTSDGITVDTSNGTQVRHNKTQDNDQGVGVYATTNAEVDHNQAKDNVSNGFFADISTSSNTFQDNKANGSGSFDCRDDSTGGFGTAGTSNFWLNDKGETSMPPGICEDH